MPFMAYSQDIQIPRHPVKPEQITEYSGEQIPGLLNTKQNSTVSQASTRPPEVHMTPRNTGGNELSDFLVNWVFVDSQNRLFIRTNDASVDVYDGSTWRHMDGNKINRRFQPADMTEDSVGNLIFATLHGVVQYSSDLSMANRLGTSQYAEYDTLSQASEQVVVDREGRIWAAHHPNQRVNTIGGISVYLPEQGRVWYDQGFLSSVGPNMAEGTIKDLLLRVNGNIWAAVSPGASTEGGIVVIPPKRDTLWAYQVANSNLPSDNVEALTQDGQGNVWTCFSQSPSDSTVGAARFDGTQWTSYTGADIPSDQPCRSIKTAPNKPVYYLTSDTTMKYDGNSWSPMTNNVNGRPLAGISSVVFGFNGQTVFSQRKLSHGNHSGGIFLNKGSSWQFMSASNDGGLFGKDIFGVSVDSGGNLWAVGFYGVGKYDGSSWTYYNKQSGLAHTYAWKVHAASNGTIWFGTQEGVTYLKDGTFQIYDKHEAFYGESIFEDSQGNIWMGSFEGKDPGILKYNQEQFTLYDTVENTLSSVVSALAEDPEGKIIASSRDRGGKQLSVYNRNDDSWSRWSPESKENIYSYEIGSGQKRNVWIPADSLYRWDGTALTAYAYPEEYTSIDVSHVEPDSKGRVWMGAGVYNSDGYNQGLIIFDKGNWHYPLKLFTGNSWGIIYDISHADNGDTWIATLNRGIYKYSRGEILSVAGTNPTPTRYKLEANYPNPFNPTTNIQFTLPQATDVQLTVYNTLGRKVATLVNQQMTTGSHKVQFNAEGLSSGVYIYRLKTEAFTRSKKMLFLK